MEMSNEIWGYLNLIFVWAETIPELLLAGLTS